MSTYCRAGEIRHVDQGERHREWPSGSAPHHRPGDTPLAPLPRALTASSRSCVGSIVSLVAMVPVRHLTRVFFQDDNERAIKWADLHQKGDETTLSPAVPVVGRRGAASSCFSTPSQMQFTCRCPAPRAAAFRRAFRCGRLETASHGFVSGRATPCGRPDRIARGYGSPGWAEPQEGGPVGKV